MNKIIVHYKAGSYLPLTETWIYAQIKNLEKYKPIVYCQGTENLKIYPTKYIRSFNQKTKKLLTPFYLFIDKPDLIHAHFGPSGYDFLVFKKIFRLPLITAFYGQDLSMLPAQFPEWRRRYQKLFKEGECFLVEGKHMKKCLVKLGCPEGKVIIRHHGVNLRETKFIPRTLKKNKTVKVLISASFREKKGIPDAIEAFGRVKNENPKLKMILTIIGDSVGDLLGEKEKKKIYNKIKKYHLKDCVTFLGYRPHSIFLEELYKHHIFLSPSITATDGDTEGGAPVSIIEASATGMPVVSTTHCDIPEVVLDKKSGYLVSERDVDSLALKLESLVSKPYLWGKMGLSGRKHIEKNYDLKKQVEQLEEIYEKVLSNKA